MSQTEIERMQEVFEHMKERYPNMTPEIEAMFFQAYTRGFSDGWWSNQHFWNKTNDPNEQAS